MKKILFAISFALTVSSLVSCVDIPLEPTNIMTIAQDEQGTQVIEEDTLANNLESSAEAISDNKNNRGENYIASLTSLQVEHMFFSNGTMEQTDRLLTATGTKAFFTELIEYFGDNVRISHIPAIDKKEEEKNYYGFVIDYSDIYKNYSDVYVYAWRNPVTDEFWYEEPYLYSNIPDSFFPIPMLDGVPIPYVRFSPPGPTLETWYKFDDASVVKSYQAQLREAGFIDLGNDRAHIDDFSVWRYDRNEDGAVLLVEIYSGADESGEYCYLEMYVNYF